MPRIFISYSRKDEKFARELATALAGLGSDIWIDVEDIPAGMKWSTAIQQGLDSAEALVVVITPDSMKSGNVEDEWQYFLDRGKPVLPIFLKEAKIPFQLNRIQWVDFKEQPFDYALVELHSKLAYFGIHLDEPPIPPGYEPPLTHGHARIPEPEPVKSRTMLYAGAVIVVLVVVLALITFVLTGNNGDGGTGELDTSGIETEIILNLTYAVQLTETYDAVAGLVFAGLTQTQEANLIIANAGMTENAPAGTLPLTQTPSITPSYTPDAQGTADAVMTGEAEATHQAQLDIEEQATQNAQATDNAPTNTPNPTATQPPTATEPPTATVTSSPTVTPSPNLDATATAIVAINQTVEAQIAQTAQALVQTIELGRATVDDALNVRSRSDASSSIMTSVARGTVLIVLDSESNQFWYKVRLPGGDEGWVDATFFDLLGEYPENRIEEVRSILQYVDGNDDFEPIMREVDGVPMVLVPSGCFTMGTSDQQIDVLLELGDTVDASDEQPTQYLCFNQPFWIDRYEVSQAQFAQFASTAERDPAFTGDDLPQDSVTWFEALAHCEARNATLPSEAQWEYASRGPDTLLFPWGNDFETDFLNWDDNGNAPVAIDAYPEGISWVGAYQMAGNVWEWTISPYLRYPAGADSRLEDETVQRVLRGASFVDGYRANIRSANRLPSRPNQTQNYYGFRCVIVENVITE